MKHYQAVGRIDHHEAHVQRIASGRLRSERMT